MTNETAAAKSVDNLVVNQEKVAEFAETIVLLDWDDTLFPSSCLASLGYRLDTQHIDENLFEALTKIGVLVEKFIKDIKKRGQVYIITNAEKGWVEHSAKKFMPGLNDILSTITIISARTNYEKVFPDSPYKWKFFAFQRKVREIVDTPALRAQPVQVLSFGDSNYEREAIRNMIKTGGNLFCKSLKFHERPTIEQLQRQIELVIQSSDYIFNYNGELDLQLSICE